MQETTMRVCIKQRIMIYMRKKVASYDSNRLNNNHVNCAKFWEATIFRTYGSRPIKFLFRMHFLHSEEIYFKSWSLGTESILYCKFCKFVCKWNRLRPRIIYTFNHSYIQSWGFEISFKSSVNILEVLG